MVFIAVNVDEHLFYILGPFVDVHKTSHLAVRLFLHAILFQDSFRLNYAYNPYQNHRASVWGCSEMCPHLNHLLSLASQGC